MSTRSEKDKQKQIQDKCQMILSQLLREEDNKYCVDCDAKGPRWASWNLGIFVCIRCAGIHRNLGVHISKVKSVNLDTWTPEQVACLQQMGNSKARAVYEAYLPDNFRRPQTDSSLEAFIRAKYEQKKYIAKEWVPLPVPKPAFDIDEEHKRDRKKKQSKTKGSPAVEIPPPQQPAALPRPHGAPVSSGSSPVASTKFDTQKTAPSYKGEASVDLLGLDIPTSDQPGEDLFDAFMSAAPLQSSVTATTTTSVTHTSTPSSLQNGFSAQQPAAQPAPISQKNNASSDLASMSEKKAVMSKESILSLYSTASNPPTHQPMFGLQGGMYTTSGIYAPQGMQMTWPNPSIGGMVDPLMAQAAVQNATSNISQPGVNVTNPFLSMSLSGLMQSGAHPSQVPCHNQLILDPTATSNMVVSGQVPLGLGQVQQQMAALQLVNQQWQSGTTVPPNMTAFPTTQPGTAPSRSNMKGHTLATNLWQ